MSKVDITLEFDEAGMEVLKALWDKEIATNPEPPANYSELLELLIPRIFNSIPKDD